MRIHVLVTLAALTVARDSLRAQQISVMAQAIPIVTRADPTATRSALTEGYLSQPAIMAHASWHALRGTATLNFEGLTLDRGELSTGGYGEGYVDRRHPHSYVHELLAGTVGTTRNTSASLFAGRGFASFGSDDPMVRPFEKFPVNHHLAQVLERLIAVAAVRHGPVLGELSVFNGDEPESPSGMPSLRRFADSWAGRVTLTPLNGAELSGSYAAVKSPEVRTGHGLDQRKSSMVARVERETSSSSRYALVEWAHTGAFDRGDLVTSLNSVLAEASACRSGLIVGARAERTDRAEEEQLLDPFRTPRPSVDLSNLGVSRWTTLTASVSSPTLPIGLVTARPFVEVARSRVTAGTPAGIFNSEFRYGASRMWMLSTGIRLRTGSMHDRMGRYGVAAPDVASMSNLANMPEMPGMPGMHVSHSSSKTQCSF